MAWISLLSLIIAIVIGVLAKVNIGIVSLGFAIILGFLGGIPGGDIIAGFPTGLFLNLTGMFFFFSIVQVNGSLALLSEKIFVKLSNLRKLYPIMVFIVSAIVMFIDPGGLTAYVVLPAIAMSIGYPLGYNPVLIGILTIFGGQAMIMTPFGVFGNIAIDVLAMNGYDGYLPMVLINMALIFLIGGVLVFIVYKGWNINHDQKIEDLTEENNVVENQSFNNQQKLTLVALVLLILSIMVLQTHAGLTAFMFSFILLALKAADEEKVFAGVPWGTIFLIVGMSTLLAVIEFFGGMVLLADLLGAVSGRWTAAPFIGLTASFMSFFALAMAGPVPALVPILEALNASIGAPFIIIELISTVFNNAFTAAISPLSLGGAMVLAAYVTLFKPTPEERQKIFGQLFAVAIGFSIIAAIIPNTGLYRIIASLLSI